MNLEISGLISRFKSIKDNIDSERISAITFSSRYNRLYNPIILKKFNEAVSDFDSIKKKHKINSMLHLVGPSEKYEDTLIELDIECNTAIGVLEALNTTLPKEELEKLISLREELSKISGNLSDKNFEKTMIKAFDEHESTHWLASSLISGRVIATALDRYIPIPLEIEKNKDDWRADWLVKQGIIKKEELETKKFLIGISKEARNLLSHRVDTFPECSDSSALLSGAIKILKILTKIDKVEK